MNYRRFGRSNWNVSEVGYGMWGLASWTGSEEREVENALEKAVELGCNFFDTAWGYGAGKSERILGKLLKRHAESTLYAATKIPPKNFKWPSKPTYTIEECFPASTMEIGAGFRVFPKAQDPRISLSIHTLLPHRRFS